MNTPTKTRAVLVLTALMVSISAIASPSAAPTKTGPSGIVAKSLPVNAQSQLKAKQTSVARRDLVKQGGSGVVPKRTAISAGDIPRMIKGKPFASSDQKKSQASSLSSAERRKLELRLKKMQAANKPVIHGRGD